MNAFDHIMAMAAEGSARSSMTGDCRYLLLEIAIGVELMCALDPDNEPLMRLNDFVQQHIKLLALNHERTEVHRD